MTIHFLKKMLVRVQDSNIGSKTSRNKKHQAAKKKENWTNNMSEKLSGAPPKNEKQRTRSTSGK